MSDLDNSDERTPLERILQSRGPADQEEIRREREFYRFFQEGSRVPWLTFGLIFGNAAVYGAMVMNGVDPLFPDSNVLRLWGANYGPLTSNGEPWRAFTSMFLHGGIIHLAANMYSLWQLGRFVERLLGHVGFLILYLLTGLAASLVSTMWHPDMSSVGASGAICGVFGSIFSLLLKQGGDLPPYIRRSIARSALLNLCIITVISMGVPIIDMSAHMGGLVAGFALGYLLIGPLTVAGRSGQWLRNVLATVAGSVALAGVFVTMPPLSDPLKIAQDHYANGTYDQGLAELEPLLAKDPKNAKTLLARISLLEGAGRWADATTEISAAIGNTKNGNELMILYATRSELLQRIDDWKGANEDLGRAISYAPDQLDRDLYHQRGFVRLMTGDMKGAEEDWRKSADMVPSFGLDKKEIAHTRAGALENIGMIYLRNGQWEEAMRWTESVNAIDSGLAWNWLFRCIAADKLGRESDAKIALQKWMSNRKKNDVDELKKYLAPELQGYFEIKPNELSKTKTAGEEAPESAP